MPNNNPFALPCALLFLLPGSRKAFFLGDGAGVGKGRQIAALIKEYWRNVRGKGGRDSSQQG